MAGLRHFFIRQFATHSSDTLYVKLLIIEPCLKFSIYQTQLYPNPIQPVTQPNKNPTLSTTTTKTTLNHNIFSDIIIILHNLKSNIKNHNTKMLSSQSNTKTTTWNRSMNWLGSKFNQLWKPFVHHHQEQQNQGEHVCVQDKCGDMGKLQRESRGEMLGVEVWVDPKEKVLRRLRKKSLNNGLQDKIKRVNNYFSQKTVNPEKPCDLLCPICLQFLVKPVLTACGHNFCMRCLDETLLFKTDCPSCRAFLRGTLIIQCQSLHQVILRQVTRHSRQQLDSYIQQQAQALEWLQSRNPNPKLLSIGSKLDIKDTEYIWCKATVKQIYSKDNKIHSILVHYEGWNSIYDQVISINSDRLANLGFYTDRPEVPHYRGNMGIQIGQQQRMYSYVVVDWPMNQQQDNFMLLPSSDLNQDDAQSTQSNRIIRNHALYSPEYFDHTVLSNQSQIQLSDGSNLNLNIIREMYQPEVSVSSEFIQQTEEDISFELNMDQILQRQRQQRYENFEDRLREKAENKCNSQRINYSGYFGDKQQFSFNEESRGRRKRSLSFEDGTWKFDRRIQNQIHQFNQDEEDTSYLYFPRLNLELSQPDHEEQQWARIENPERSRKKFYLDQIREQFNFWNHCRNGLGLDLLRMNQALQEEVEVEGELNILNVDDV